MNQSEIELKETNEEGFLHLLKYIYTGRINLKELKVCGLRIRI